MTSGRTTHVRLDVRLHARLTEVHRLTGVPITALLDRIVNEALPRFERAAGGDKSIDLTQPGPPIDGDAPSGSAAARARAIALRRQAVEATREAHTATATEDYERAQQTLADKQEADRKAAQVALKNPQSCGHTGEKRVLTWGSVCVDCGGVIRG